MNNNVAQQHHHHSCSWILWCKTNLSIYLAVWFRVYTLQRDPSSRKCVCVYVGGATLHACMVCIFSYDPSTMICLPRFFRIGEKAKNGYLQRMYDSSVAHTARWKVSVSLGKNLKMTNFPQLRWKVMVHSFCVYVTDTCYNTLYMCVNWKMVVHYFCCIWIIRLQIWCNVVSVSFVPRCHVSCMK